MFSAIVLLVVLSVLTKTNPVVGNAFEATRGCRQYNSNRGYYFAHPYFATSALRNVRRRADNTVELRLGMVGRSDGHIRLSSVQNPYNRTPMHEIVLDGWGGTRSAVRRYIRTSPNRYTDRNVLLEQPSRGMMSEYRPLMLTLAISPTRLVTLTREGETVPFMKFWDPTVSVNFISFCNWEVPVIYFYDCPFE